MNLFKVSHYTKRHFLFTFILHEVYRMIYFTYGILAYYNFYDIKKKLGGNQMKNNQSMLDNLLFLAWSASIIAMFGSLYFSEVRQYEPCELCWYQRILMYPLTVILGIALVRKDYQISFYTMILSGIGALISTYHYLIQKVPFFTDHAASCGRVPCTGQYIKWLGFISIPFLALIAFLIIFISSYIIWKRKKEDKA
jgi:disulfide bond formation protein DsbB